MMRWLQVTIPLTFLTGLSAWVGRKALQRGWEQENKTPYVHSHPPDESRDWVSRVQQSFTQPRPLLPLSEK